MELILNNEHNGIELYFGEKHRYYEFIDGQKSVYSIDMEYESRQKY